MAIITGSGTGAIMAGLPEFSGNIKPGNMRDGGGKSFVTVNANLTVRFFVSRNSRFLSSTAREEK
jgi:hypothetical protein